LFILSAILGDIPQNYGSEYLIQGTPDILELL
jgi:hypothetical protein